MSMQEVSALMKALGRLAAEIGKALLDGKITLEEALAIGVDAASVGKAIAALADREDPRVPVLRAKALLTAGRALLRQAKRAA